jgi:hypothetical protein
MRLLPTFALALTVSTSNFLTGDFKTDVNKLSNCSLLDNLWARKKEFNHFKLPYHNRLMRTMMPWYKQNCGSNVP